MNDSQNNIMASSPSELPQAEVNNFNPTSPLESALYYAEGLGFSVIPVRQDKKPYISWKEFQGRRATQVEIEEWWGEWPDAMIGIVTGKVSGLFVVDCDLQEGYRSIEELLPDSLEVPMVRTPRDGWHLYFRYPGHGLSVGAGVMCGVDFWGECGYVIAPPSVKATGRPMLGRTDWPSSKRVLPHCLRGY